MSTYELPESGSVIQIKSNRLVCWSTCLLCAILLGSGSARRLPAQNITQAQAVDSAKVAALAAILADPSCPIDEAVVEARTESAFLILYPQLAELQRVSDPSWVAARAAAAATILDPAKTAAQAMQTPGFLEGYQAAISALMSGGQLPRMGAIPPPGQ